MLVLLSKGFTLIELLVVIGILSVLFSITLVAINPARQFALANNIQRRSDVKAILDGLYQYAADNHGVLPTGVPLEGTSTPIASLGGTGSGFCAAIVPTYIAILPQDPSGGAYTDCFDYSTGYLIYVSTSSAGNTPRITISAPNAELEEDITITR